MSLQPDSAPGRVTVLVVAYQSDQWLPDCVRTLEVAWYPQDSLLIVDNTGNTVLPALSQRISGTKVITTQRPLGFAEANNFGLVRGALDGEFVCFLNQDTRVESGWLDACVDCLESHPDVGAVLPLLKTYDGNDWDAGFRTCFELSTEFQRDAVTGQFAEFYEVPQVSAAALVVRSDVLRIAGPFDPIFGSYYEDYDLCRRIRHAGYRVGICGHGTVRHFNGSSTTTTAAKLRRMRQIIRNRAIHGVRSGKTGRIAMVLRQFARTLPLNVARGIARTTSSQPVRVQLAAHFDLMRIMDRLLFERRDSAAWRGYLASIGWNQLETAAARTEQGMRQETVA